MTAAVRAVFVAQTALGDDDEARIRALLVAAYPQHSALFSRQSYWGSLPDWRLWLQDDAGEPLAHCGFGLRTIDVAALPVRIAGVGAVATHPSVQRRGLGVRLFDALRGWLRERGDVDFAFLECRPGIVPFYQRAGFVRRDQVVWCLDPDSRQWEESIGPKMVMPIAATIDAWPVAGRIDLRGMPW